MDIEQKVKTKLLIRGFSNENLLNNRGLIGATTDEAILEVVKNLGIANVSNCALFENEKLVSNMCISFRHDFGLLPKLIQEDLKRDCKEWLRAYDNNKEHCC